MTRLFLDTNIVVDLLVYVAQAFLPPDTSSASGTTSEKEAASKKTGSSFGGLGFFSYLCALSARDCSRSHT